MKLVLIAVPVFLVFGAIAPAYGQPNHDRQEQDKSERQRGGPPQQQQHAQQPEQQQPQRSDQQARVWQQQSGWNHQGAWQEHATWQQDRSSHWQTDHRTWGKRGGYSFMLVDPWPEDWALNWYATDDVYVGYNSGYYLYNRMHPGEAMAITVVL